MRLYSTQNPLTPLASANVSSSDPTEGSPTTFYTQAITPVTLPAGMYYIVEDVNSFQAAAGGVTTAHPSLTAAVCRALVSGKTRQRT